MFRFSLAIITALGIGVHDHAVLAQETPQQGDGSEGALSPSACQERLDAQHVTFAFAPPVAEGNCVIPLPVRLQSLTTGARSVAIKGEPILDCRLAERLADWVGNVVAPLAEHHLGSGLAAVETGPGYVCRNRNNEAGGKLSEHAKGNAIDIFAFDLVDGRRMVLRPDDQPIPSWATFLAAVRGTACGYFLTVLGPGSDASHAEHLHLDLGPHGRTANYRICE